MNEDRLMGVVLCGGESRRMGKDKGSLLKEGIPWARWVAEKLTPFKLPVVYSVNQLQLETYTAFIPVKQLVPDIVVVPIPHSLALAGPLNGLLSVHVRFPSNDLLLLGCDMLDLDGQTIGKMISAYRKHHFFCSEYPDRKRYEFYVYHGVEFAQPFCGIYTSSGLQAVYSRAILGQLSDLRLQSTFDVGKTKRIAIDREEAFANYNSL